MLRCFRFSIGCLVVAGAATVGCAASSDEESSGASTHKLGEPCSQTADCGESQTCHKDTVDYLANGQCAKSCESSEECEAQFGKSSMCIGAGICVQECKEAADCPEKTKCNNSGWCERSGKGSGNPYCTGTPLPCSLQSSCLSSGCYTDGECTGIPSTCSYKSQYSCSETLGCSWSYSQDKCTGSAYPCSSMFSMSTCMQQGCIWQDKCAGVVTTRCDDLSYGLCKFTEGCITTTD